MSDDYSDVPWLIVITIGVGGLLIAALLIGLSMDAGACAQRGGAYVRSGAFGGYSCVRQLP